MADHELREAFQELRQRMERLEKLLGIPDWPPTPGFDLQKFQRILVGYLIWPWLLFLLPFAGGLLLINLVAGQASADEVLGLPLWNVGGQPSVAGMTLGVVAVGGGAIGLVSLGGLSIGGLAFGGGAFGLVAVGGGAVGLVAFGGGSLGVIAIGGGAQGYIAIGGGALGVYVLAGEGRGRYVFDRRRQDEQAVRFFCTYLPRLRQAFTEESAYRITES